MQQPLFYGKVVPLDRDAHRELRLAAEPSYGFAAQAHLIPAVLDEFPAACADLPIVFAHDLEGAWPMFLTGLRPGHNTFVRADGCWSAAYVPAYLRRYPFILGERPDGEPLVCLDETAEALKAGQGASTVALFDPEARDTERLAEAIRLAADYAASAQRTLSMCRSLVELKLLQPITIQADANGASNALHGLLAIEEASLDALPDAGILRLRAEGLLGPVYTHLVSLRAIARWKT